MLAVFSDDSQARYPLQTFSAIRLARFEAAGKPVLDTDHVTKPCLIGDFYAKANARGCVPYATRHDLDVLKVNRGHEPD